MIITKKGTVKQKLAMTAIFRMWMPAAKKVRKVAQMGKEALKEKNEKRRKAAENMEEEARNNHTAKQWEIMRRMGGTNRGPKKRKMDVPLTEYPDANEWLKHLQQEGKNGGCKARNKRGLRGTEKRR